MLLYSHHDKLKKDFIIIRMSDPVPQRGDGGNSTQLSWIDLDMTVCNGSETNFNQCKFRPVTIYQPGCYATRAVTCISE